MEVTRTKFEWGNSLEGFKSTQGHSILSLYVLHEFATQKSNSKFHLKLSLLVKCHLEW